MDKQQAQEIIEETFESSFDKKIFTGFIKNLLNRIEDSPFTYQGNYIPDAYKQYIKTLERIGKFSDGENNIDILVINLQKETSLERARTMQRNFIAWYLNGSRGGEMKDAALAAFVSPDNEDWRFSLVKMDYKFEQSKSGRMKVKEEFTPARRWSFLVGKNEKSHTAQIRLVNILKNDEQDPTMEEIEKAFDIETVTKEFFLEYRGLFLYTKDELDRVVKKDPKIKADFMAKEVDTVNFAKKLLGQIVFLYFLQKKGWFGVGRDDNWDTGSKHFLRELFEKKHSDYNNFYNDILEPLFYEALRIDRSHDDGYYSRFDCKIPFLNGGLFDPIGNYDWVHTDIIIPDKLFSNNIKTKEGDKGTGILDVFDRYNFTVKEDEPLEKEVAIDPELLGKAYEKFNAIRPDNYAEFKKALKSGKTGEENKFNKKFGVYYTPREIVHYMCRQSLINYLHTEVAQASSLSISKKDIESLIHLGEQVSENEATALLKEKLIAEGKQKTTKNKPVLPESIKNNAALIDNKLEEIMVCDPAVGSGAFPVGMMSEIVKVRNVLSVFLNDKKRIAYDFKRSCIEHSLYGVDIDPGAVEIAKLRLWLSLVVDEDDIKNIKPLPNLDYKIVCGNSLLGVEKNLFNLNFFNELEKLKPLFFNETNPTKKQEYRVKIDDLISKITNGHREFDFEVYFSEVFHEKGGFDVVMANPPYVRVDKIPVQQKYQLKKIFKTCVGKYDLYYLFIEKAINLLKDNGNLVFITPNKYCAATSGNVLRQLILNKMGFCEIISTSKLGVFEEASNYPIISVLQKGKPNAQFIVREALGIDSLKDSTDNIYNIEHVKLCQFPKIIIPINVSQNKVNIVIKLLEKYSPLREYLSISEGLRIPPKYEQESEDSFGIVKQYQFSRWSLVKKGTSISQQKLSKVVSGTSSRFKKILNRKILIAEDALQITATIDENKNVPQGGVYFGTLVNDSINLKVILALMNSRLLSSVYEYLFSGMHMGGGYLRYRTKFLEELPIALKSNVDYDKLMTITDSILSIAKDEDYLQNQQKQSKVKALEAKIDQLVYKLYKLTPEEIKIVEGGK